MIKSNLFILITGSLLLTSCMKKNSSSNSLMRDRHKSTKLMTSTIEKSSPKATSAKKKQINISNKDYIEKSKHATKQQQKLWLELTEPRKKNIYGQLATPLKSLFIYENKKWVKANIGKVKASFIRLPNNNILLGQRSYSIYNTNSKKLLKMSISRITKGLPKVSGQYESIVKRIIGNKAFIQVNSFDKGRIFTWDLNSDKLKLIKYQRGLTSLQVNDKGAFIYTTNAGIGKKESSSFVNLIPGYTTYLYHASSISQKPKKITAGHIMYPQFVNNGKEVIYWSAGAINRYRDSRNWILYKINIATKKKTKLDVATLRFYENFRTKKRFLRGKPFSYNLYNTNFILYQKNLKQVTILNTLNGSKKSFSFGDFIIKPIITKNQKYIVLGGLTRTKLGYRDKLPMKLVRINTHNFQVKIIKLFRRKPRINKELAKSQDSLRGHRFAHYRKNDWYLMPASSTRNTRKYILFNINSLEEKKFKLGNKEAIVQNIENQSFGPMWRYHNNYETEYSYNDPFMIIDNPNKLQVVAVPSLNVIFEKSKRELPQNRLEYATFIPNNNFRNYQQLSIRKFKPHVYIEKSKISYSNYIRQNKTFKYGKLKPFRRFSRNAIMFAKARGKKLQLVKFIDMNPQKKEFNLYFFSKGKNKAVDYRKTKLYKTFATGRIIHCQTNSIKQEVVVLKKNQYQPSEYIDVIARDNNKYRVSMAKCNIYVNKVNLNDK